MRAAFRAGRICRAARRRAPRPAGGCVRGNWDRGGARGAHRGRLTLAVHAPRPAKPAAARSVGATAAAPAPGAFAPARVFSTPVVGADETVHVGSADTWFYALGRRGRPRWRFKTGEIIDSAAVLGRRERRLRSSTVTFGSEDEHIYRLRTAPRRLSRAQRTVWRFRATRKPATGQLVNWWEGNVTMGFGGALFAGNTGGAVPIGPTESGAGSFRPATPSGRMPPSATTAPSTSARSICRSTRSTPAVACAGGVAPATSSPPRRRSLRTAPSMSHRSTARSTRSTPRTGESQWTFATDDHVYASPALAEESSTSPRRTAPSIPSIRRSGGCAGATTRATRCARRRCWAAARSVTVTSSTWARRTGACTRSTPRAGGGAGRSTPRRAMLSCATATT